MDPRQLRPWPRNPRLNDPAVQKVAESIQRFGFGAPIVARSADFRIIAGHTRVRAALQLGMDRIPVRLLDLSDADSDALSLADNKLNELAQWDGGLLADMAGEIDLSELGWSEADLSELELLGDLVSGSRSGGESPLARQVQRADIVINVSAEQFRDFEALADPIVPLAEQVINALRQASQHASSRQG